MKLSHSRRKGFTLVELVVVGTFTVILGVVAVVSLFGWREQKELNATARQIATVLREAGSRAMVQSRGTVWGVHFDNTDPSQPYYALFFGSTYDPSNRISYHRLPSSIRFDADTLGTGTDKDIIFNQITGKPSENFSVRISLGKEDEGSSTIQVNDIGAITFDVFSCTITCTQTTVTLPPPPVIAIAADPASIIQGESTVVTWSAENADSCAAIWTSQTGASGSEVETPSVTTEYSMTCKGPGGEDTKSVIVDVIPKPTLDLQADPASIIQGESTTLSWTSANATSCSAIWTTQTSVSGSEIESPPETTTYSMTCTGDGGEASDSVTVSVEASSGGGGGNGGGGGVKPRF